MDKIELKIITWSGIVMTLFLIALLLAAKARNVNVPECIPYNSAFTKPEVRKIDDKTYELFMVAKMWNFEPAEVKIPVGSEVDLYLSTPDVVHGFHIEKKAVNLMAVPGAINKKTISFDEPGVYKIVCHEYCGIGHQNMESTIIVTDKITE